MKKLLLSVAVAGSAMIVAPAAHAAHSITYNYDPFGSFTASFENPTPTNPFNDTFTPFTTTLGGSLSGTLTTVGVTPSNDVDFTLARVEGNTLVDFFPLTVTPGGGNPDALEFGFFVDRPITAGTYTLRVAGNRPGANGSYSGTLAFSPVPEPGTWAMMLFGFGAVGFGLRRRRKESTRVRFAF